MKKFLFIILVLLVAVIGYAQDPGERDTLRFGEWGVYLPCPPCSGIATIPIHIFHDESLVGIQISFGATGPIAFSSVNFTPEVENYFEFHGINISPTGDRMTIDLANQTGPAFPVGSRIMGYLLITVSDTGTAIIDTVPIETPVGCFPVGYATTNLDCVDPIFISTIHKIIQQEIKPGDINGEGHINLGDIIYLVNYLFKNGSEPVNKQMADVNVDCVIDLSDLLNIVSYVFKSGPSLLPGCSE